MRPLLDFLRWRLLDLLNWIWPPEQPTEEEYIAYLKEEERLHAPNVPVTLIEHTHEPGRRKQPQVQHTGPIAPVACPVVLGIRQRAQLRQASGELFSPPIRRVELVADDSWLNSRPHTDPIKLSGITTRPVAKDETEKYKALPSWVKE